MTAVQGTIGRAAIAIALAREGVPICAIARVIQEQAALVNDLLMGAIAIGELKELPPIEWQREGEGK